MSLGVGLLTILSCVSIAHGNDMCSAQCMLDSSKTLTSLTQPTNAEGLKIYMKSACDAYSTLESCIVLCPNGQATWNTYASDPNMANMLKQCDPAGTTGDGSTSTCSLACQMTMGEDMQNIAKTMEGMDDMTRAYESTKQTCSVFGNYRTCLLPCHNGEQLWMDVTKDTNNEHILKMCGGIVTGEGTVDDILCPTKCKYTIGAKFTQSSLPEDGSSQTLNAEQIVKYCGLMREMDGCLRACPIQTYVMQETASGDANFADMAKTCGISLTIPPSTTTTKTTTTTTQYVHHDTTESADSKEVTDKASLIAKMSNHGSSHEATSAAPHTSDDSKESSGCIAEPAVTTMILLLFTISMASCTQTINM